MMHIRKHFLFIAALWALVATANAQNNVCDVNPNDTAGLRQHIPYNFIRSQMKGNYKDDFGADLTAFGLEFLQLMKEHITNPVVKHALLDECAYVVLNYGKHHKDIDRFWIPFCAYAADDSTVIRKYQVKVNALKNTKAGMKAPDFTFIDRNGNEHRLSNFHGKVLYIDFWATWCGPCCKQIPFLEKQVEAFRDNDKVLFISISTDRNRQTWLKKLEQDNPQWPQFLITHEGDRVLHEGYGITAIPRFVIIHPDGIIADADAFRPSDEDFKEKLNEIIGE